MFYAMRIALLAAAVISTAVCDTLGATRATRSVNVASSSSSVSGESGEVLAASSTSHGSLMRREASVHADAAASSPERVGKINDTGTSKPASKSKVSTGAKVAICFSGLLRGLPEGRIDNLMKSFVEPLGEHADIFFTGPPYPGKTVAATRELLEPLALMEARLIEEPRVEELWAQAYAAIPADSFSVIEAFGETGGATAFGPVFGNGYGIYQWFWRDHCMDMLQKQEESQGHEYERVIVTRFDMNYLTTHPPLKLLDPRSVWIPAGGEETGYNDHHAVIPRQNMSVWLGIYKSLMSGDVASYMKTASMLSSWRNPEVLLKAVANHHSLDVKHFPAAAAVIGCPGTGDFHCTFGTCNRKKYKDFKSCEEAETAFKTAKWVEDAKGWSADVMKMG